MRLLISHIYNEEYLLPWWIRQHREMFDHAVIIDFASTDRSVEIIRDMAPGWEIEPADYPTFKALLTDFQVMKIEQRFPGAWKIALNVTEFLVGPLWETTIGRLERKQAIVARVPAAIMVDPFPDAAPVADQSLPGQKHHGYWEDAYVAVDPARWLIPPPRRLRAGRARLLHRYEIGAYKPGRHESYLGSAVPIDRNAMAIYWYAYSPWTPRFLERKLQIAAKLDPFEAALGKGTYHLSSAEDREGQRQSLLGLAVDLTDPKALSAWPPASVATPGA